VSVAPVCVEIKEPGCYKDRVQPAAVVPHRSPWLVLDRVEVDGDEARGAKLVTAGDPLAADGTLPVVMVVEALAQAAAAVMGARAAAAGPQGGHHGYLTELRGVTFSGRVPVGGCLDLTARRTHSLGRLHRFMARATCDGAPLCEGEMSFAVETFA
jgi:3-hydroxymyristoyl/3-hydroxydecanoyl-(acyl carrier protein) dehydratase